MQGVRYGSEGFGLAHAWPQERDDYEARIGATYCRVCGRLLAKDRDPGWVQPKSCSTPGISFRWF